MKDELIKFETAKLAKEKGFDAPCRNYFLWDERNGVWNFPLNANEMLLGDESNFNRPTQSLLQRWVREVHGIHFVMIPTITSAWTYKLLTVLSERDNDVIIGIKSISDVPPYKDVCGYDFSTYELALESALLEALNLIQPKP